MSRRVFKYPVSGSALVANHGMFDLELPIGAQVVHVSMQHGQLCLWALVDPDAAAERREFVMCGTGHPVPENATHVQSFLMDDGEFVWHIFAPRDEKEQG
jgi:hypothetical protein